MRVKRQLWPVVVAILLTIAGWPHLTQRTILAADPATGPQTEKRFPPLKVPIGFQATLFACDPLVEYPSVIALGPKPGTLFVAHDYMTGLGIKIVRRDEVRLLQDTNGDGYADKSTVYAGGFHSIQGLAYDNGVVFVMHAPLLTALKDTNGDGVADSRRDIVKGLGLPPEKNPNRLHCANGVVAGHDGWLYLALGDRGCDVKRPEGDRLLFQQGGILRCRTDGRDLHVFAGGLRNIYDIALDEELNVFVRDNENDGGDYMIRVCRSFFGADHGYPYHYYERPIEALRPLADLGRGSSAGGTSYLESAFPQQFRESLFFCEWGRAVVRYRKSRAGSHFADMQEIDFAAGAPNDPYGFKPTDLVVDYDGSLLISDWCDGQRPKRGRGRIYRIAYVGESEKSSPRKRISTKTSLTDLLKALNSPSYSARVSAQRELERRGAAALPAVNDAMKKRQLTPLGRLHVVWILARLNGRNAIEDLLRIAEKDADPRVQAQAVRALADLTDPLLVRHRLSADQGDESIAGRLAALVSKDRDPRVALEVLVLLGRLRWSAAPGWLRKQWDTITLDPSTEHAAMQLLRRANNWPAVLKLLDEPSQKVKRTGLRTLALIAIADRAENVIVDGVIERLNKEKLAERRSEYVDVLARVYKKNAVWTYWGFRPAPRPANTVAWERSEKIRTTLDSALSDAAVSVRVTALKRMQREKIPVRHAALADWLRKEKDANRVKTILQTLDTFPADDVRVLLEQIVRDKNHTQPNRVTALVSLARGLPATSAKQLLTLAQSIEDGPVLAAAIRALGQRKTIDSDRFLLAKLISREPTVRAAAVYSLAERDVRAVAKSAVALLSDPDVRVRRAAAFAVGKLKVSEAVGRLRKLATSTDRDVCRESLQSLLVLRDREAVPQAVAALKFSETQLAALAYLEEFGDTKRIAPVIQLAATNRSTDVTIAIIRTLSRWSAKTLPKSSERLQLNRAIATVHQNSGVLLHWSVAGPLSEENGNRLTKDLTSSSSADLPAASNRIAMGTDAAVRLSPASAKKTAAGTTWLAVANVLGDQPENVEFLASATGTLRVWLNGKEVFHRKKPASYQPDSDRFDAKLIKGVNRLVVRIEGQQLRAQFHLRFRTKSSQADHERLIALALRGQGSVLRGREVFFKAEKSQCIKCHRLGDEGGRIGPDLTGVGSRFSKIHLVESLLQPSRTIAPSYATYSAALFNGKVISGVKVAQTEKTVTLGDKDGKTHVISRSQIEFLRRQSKSTMPDGLEKRLTDSEFLHLIAFLLSQKKTSSKEVTP